MPWRGSWRDSRPCGARRPRAAFLLPPRERPGPFWPAFVLFERLRVCDIVCVEPLLVGRFLPMWLD